MKNKIVAPILGPLFKKLAPRIGAKIIIEPKWGIVGQIIFASGKKRYFRYTSVDLNTLGSSEVAVDKDYANFFMKKMGYPTIPGQAFFSDHWARTIGSKNNIDAAYHYAQKIGWPVFVKPNSGSQGQEVSKVRDKAEFYSALRHIFKEDRVALVQTMVSGKDYRIVVLDNKVISAYQRIPLSVTGDEVSSIKKLVQKKLNQLAALGRPAQIKINDQRIIRNLKELKLAWHSVLQKDKSIFLLNNANLSTGGQSIDVTKKIHPGFKKLAIKLTKDMGLRICGVDLMVAGDIGQAPKKYWVIEINAAPGLDHYIKTGPEQEKIVEKMYLEVLKAMEK